jgi:chemotaxis protein methyltransferase CheR
MSVPAAANEAREVSDDQLLKYADLIYAKTGVRIPPQKKTLLSNRLRRRLKALSLDCYQQYYELLNRLRRDDPEWDYLFQEVTTHETFLFREMVQWDWFRDDYLKAVHASAMRNERPRRLRVWSAACSTGDEAYTMAVCIADALPDFERWQIQIVGTDIGVGVLEEAATPVFNARRMRDVPEKYRKRYFRQRRGEDAWEPVDAIRKLTHFKKHNLMQPLAEAPFDVVFIKNVLIYFDDASKQTVLDHVIDRLTPGGYLITGRAEGVTQFLKNFQRMQPWLHGKPANAGRR